MNSPCKFVRNNRSRGRWEYGHILIENIASKDEKRIYVVDGEASDYEEALRDNEMAARGKDRTHHFDYSARPLGKEK